MTTHATSPPPDLHTRAEEAAAVLRDAAAETPRLAVVLGSGLNELADRIADATIVPYDRIPHFPRTTVAGHEGKVLLGKLGGVPAIVFQGRFHYYEGHDLETVTFPVRVLQKLGVSTLILTAATGGIRADLRAGNLVLLTDHLNLIGSNPLRGLNDPRLGHPFSGHDGSLFQAPADDRQGRGKEAGDRSRAGRLCLFARPQLRDAGRDQDVAHPGCRRGGNVDRPRGDRRAARRHRSPRLRPGLQRRGRRVGTPITHEEVLEAGRKAAPTLARLIERVVTRLAAAETTSS